MHIRRINGAIGAEITDLRLHPDLGDADVAALRAALLEHKVVFLPGQGHLDDAAHAGFVRRLGPLTGAHPTITGGQEEAAVLPVDSGRGTRSGPTTPSSGSTPRPTSACSSSASSPRRSSGATPPTAAR